LTVSAAADARSTVKTAPAVSRAATVIHNTLLALQSEYLIAFSLA
jgi:hypothetical protein